MNYPMKNVSVLIDFIVLLSFYDKIADKNNLEALILFGRIDDNRKSLRSTQSLLENFANVKLTKLH